jgi:hypothetical protein
MLVETQGNKRDSGTRIRENEILGGRIGAMVENPGVVDEELKFPEWQAPLQEVILEFDREKLPEKIQKVETLIFERLQQLRQESDGRNEREAINNALSILRVIKRDKLGFPDWK